MKTETFEGVIESYQGKKLDTPIKFTGEAELFTNRAEAEAATKWPGDSEILDLLNNKLLTAAKAKVYQAKTADLKKEYENSPAFKRANFIKSALAMGMSQAQAEAIADSNLG